MLNEERKSVLSWETAAEAFAIAYSLFHIYTAGFGFFPNLIQRSLHVGLALLLCFMLYRGILAKKRRLSRPTALDVLLMLVAVCIPLYFIVDYDRIITGGARSTQMDLWFGTVTVIVVMIGARRTMGWVFPIIAALSLAYAYFGPYLPGILAHAGAGWKFMIEQLFLSASGLWGVTTSVTATIVAVFVIFGAILMRTGGGDAFINIALWLAGRAKGGPAKVAMISSALFGMINGSAAANAAVTGNLTIPMMKRSGFRPEYAAGVEAMASSGGNIAPPILGTAAFIMAELIGVPYRDIMIAAAIPAFLYFFGGFMSIHFESMREGLRGLDESDVPKARDVFRYSSIGPLFIPVAILLALVFADYTVTRAGFWAIVSAIALYLLPGLKSPKNLKNRAKEMVLALRDGGYGLVMIGIMSAVAQIVVCMISITGLSITLSNSIISLSGSYILLTFVVAMIVCIILGMGMPTAPAYILGAAVLAPALTKLGVPPLVAHMFIFYFTTISSITPPVCAAVYITAGIANANWFRSSLIACQIGLVTFIVPYTFIYSQDLLLQGQPLSILWSFVTATLGTLALAAGTMRYMLVRTAWPEILLLVAASVLLIAPEPISDLAGLAVLALVFLFQRFKRKKEFGLAAGA